MNIDNFTDMNGSDANGIKTAWMTALRRLLAPVRRYGTQLERKHWILLLDAAWIALLALLVFGGQPILYFHLLFVSLTLGAFYWSFKDFALRAGIAASLATATFTALAWQGVIPDEELLEVPELIAIMVIVFLIARQRSIATKALQSLNEQLEFRVAEKTAKLEAEIQERRQAEVVLLESREQYRHLVELAFEAIVIHANERVIHVNHAAVELLGAESSNELMGRPIQDFIHPDSQALVRQRLQQLSAGANGLPPAEEKFIGLDGKSVDVEVASIEIVYREHPALLTVMRDITPRKQAEEARLAERMSIARDLHDLLGQNLGYLHLKLDQFAAYNPTRPLGEIQRELVRMRAVADEAYQQIRAMIAANLPANSAPLGGVLRAKAATIGERAQFAVKIIEKGRPHELTSVVQEQVLSLCGEALTNVGKHSCATEVKIMLCWYERSMSLTIADNGCGFDVTTARQKPAFGLRIMEERAAQVHGKLGIQSQPGRGTKLALQVPYPSMAREW